MITIKDDKVTIIEIYTRDILRRFHKKTGKEIKLAENGQIQPHSQDEIPLSIGKNIKTGIPEGSRWFGIALYRPEGDRGANAMVYDAIIIGSVSDSFVDITGFASDITMPVIQVFMLRLIASREEKYPGADYPIAIPLFSTTDEDGEGHVCHLHPCSVIRPEPNIVSVDWIEKRLDEMRAFDDLQGLMKKMRTSKMFLPRAGDYLGFLITSFFCTQPFFHDIERIEWLRPFTSYGDCKSHALSGFKLCHEILSKRDAFPDVCQLMDICGIPVLCYGHTDANINHVWLAFIPANMLGLENNTDIKNNGKIGYCEFTRPHFAYTNGNYVEPLFDICLRILNATESHLHY